MITFTEKATEMLQKKIGHYEGKVLRIRVIGGGCSGLQYQIHDEPLEKVLDSDNMFDGGGFEVAVDPKSMLFLAGSEVDYEEVFGGGHFVVNNPNASRTCGCGKSFS